MIAQAVGRPAAWKDREGIKRDGRCARDSASSSPLSLTLVLSLSSSLPRSFLSFFSGVPPTPSRSTYLPFYFSIFLPLVPPLPVPCSLYPVRLSRSLPPRPSRSHPRTSAFLSAERRTGFRRKETTIRRIVATDHSWRVDRINPSELAAATNRIARDTQVSSRRALRVPSDLYFFFIPSPRHRG